MQGLTVEYQRFGDPTGVIRLSDRYIRTVGTTAPAEEVGFAIFQENLDVGMSSLAYENFSRARGDVDGVRNAAEQFLKDLTPHLEDFLPTQDVPIKGKGPYQIDIVTRALELAQLPFEVLEDAHPNLVITRRIRQPWPSPEIVRKHVPRVLFAWAEPMKPGSQRRMEVPHQRHRELLDALLQDWGEQAIVEIGNATGQDLTRALDDSQQADGDNDHRFTHVHLLAHGIGPERPAMPPAEPIDLMRAPSPSTHLALENEDGTLDRCAPQTLAAIFSRVPRPETFALATCQSGQIGSIHSHATLAHVLHAAGVPVVLASQLALTKDGSDELIRTFLAQIIDGRDPRDALRACRDRLRQTSERTYYDRVGLVGYVHVDGELDERLKERRFEVALRRLNAISKHAHDAVAQAVTDLDGFKELTAAQRAEAQKIHVRFRAVREQLGELEREHTYTKTQLEELRGLQGSSLKRESEAAWRLSRVLPAAAAKEWLEHSHLVLRDAAVAYGRAARLSRDHHWTWVQCLVLDAVGCGSLKEREEDWVVAKAAALDAAGREAPQDATQQQQERIAQRAAWGWGSLCELSLLAPLVGRGNQLAEAKRCLDALLAAARKSGDTYPVLSMLDQLARYEIWWGEDDHWKLPADVVAQAKELSRYLTRKAETVEEPQMLSIEMLPADEGDALWIEYGTDPVRRILIDCGRKTAYRAVAKRLGDDPDVRFELLVLTHVDADHIAGAVPLLQDPRFGRQRVGDVWFNGWRHLNGLHRDYEGDIPGTLSAKQGEYFGAVLRDRDYAWNTLFDGTAVVVQDAGALPQIELAGGLKLTLLGPTWDKLSDMRRRWEDDLDGTSLEAGDYEAALELLGGDKRHGPDVLGGGHEGPIVVSNLLEVPFEADGSEPNGSSISFLAEFDGRAVLFAADGHAPQIEASVRRLLAERGLETLRLDAFKMSHHGSARNNSTALLELLDCPRYLVSTSGSRHHHPDPEALARVLDVHGDGVQFYFNYKSDETEPWADPDLKAQHGYEVYYPEGRDGTKVTL